MKTNTIPFTSRGHSKSTNKSLQRWGALVSAAMIMTVGANAADIVWQGAATGDWNTAGNWSPAQVPGAADNAFFTNSGTFTVTLSANSLVGSVTVRGHQRDADSRFGSIQPDAQRPQHQCGQRQRPH